MEERRCRWEHLDNLGDVYTARTGHAVVNEDGVFYLFGGTDGAARQSDVHAYNVETNLWQEIRSNGRPPPARSGAQAVVWNGAVWFFGGYTKKDGDYFNDVYKYDIATSTWGSVHTLGESPQKRTDHSVVLFRDSLLVFGGFDGHNRFNDLRELHLRERRWNNIKAATAAHPRSRFGHTAVVYGHSMFIFGGWDGHDTLQELQEYNISSNMWLHLSNRGNPPRARYRHTAVVCGDAMFTFGGVDKTQYRFPDLHEYCFTSKLWSKVSTTSVQPSARTFHKTVVHEGAMYILGGFDGRRLNDMYRILLRTPAELAQTDRQFRDQEGGNGAVSSRDGGSGGMQAPGVGQGAVGDAQDVAEAHMPEDLWCWQRVGEQQGQVYTPRTGHAVVVWNHCFYLMGGTDENARQNDIYRYDVRNRNWVLIEPVSGHAPSARSGSKAVVCRDSIFFFGGYTKKDGDYFNDLFEFNIPRAHWTRVDSSMRPSVRTDHSCVVYEGSLFIFGGFDGKSRFQDLHQYDVDIKEWTEIPTTDNSPLGRFGHTAVCYKSGMFVFGGWNGHDTLDDLYEFSFTTQQWYSVPGRGDVPPSRYRHSMVVHGCCAFIFGGVDKRQARFADLCEFSFDTRNWSRVKTLGDTPSARTFHRAVMYGGCMYILGGFDGSRRNDMYKIAVPEQLPRGDERRRKMLATASAQDEAAAEPEAGEFGGDCGESNSVVSKLRLQVLELQKRLETELERHLCKICYEREINTVILDCNHRAGCARCLDQVATCPLCRAQITKIIQTYSA
eukprot:TRINITY_DN121257_c0_g1_i1.p1 TRINITY_DN121257_c0_g1~~TRINITY_DN121257_c0_g1_i1.p1  ORF type:complete len:780 (+),score=173.99 TRINITY_DN121257_c0_g1_i1:233-2572(+)